MPSRSSNYDYSKENQVKDTQKIYYKAPTAEPIDEATSSIGSQLTQPCNLHHFPQLILFQNPLKSTKITYVKISIQ